VSRAAVERSGSAALDQFAAEQHVDRSPHPPGDLVVQDPQRLEGGFGNAPKYGRNRSREGARDGEDQEVAEHVVFVPQLQ
jgi:hypothetical protein